MAGFIALFVRKGAVLHRRSGMIFVTAMVILGVTGVIIATIKSQPANMIGGAVALYMVTTGALAFVRRTERTRWMDAATMVAAILISCFSTRLGLRAFHSPSGNINGVPAVPLFVFAAVALLAAGGDFRVLLVRGLRGRQRVARHLWRMCFVMFVASGSLFIGQAKVIPKPIRIYPLLAIPTLLPVALLLYWLARVSFTQWDRPRPARPGALP